MIKNSMCYRFRLYNEFKNSGEFVYMLIGCFELWLKPSMRITYYCCDKQKLPQDVLNLDNKDIFTLKADLIAI